MQLRNKKTGAIANVQRLELKDGGIQLAYTIEQNYGSLTSFNEEWEEDEEEQSPSIIEDFYKSREPREYSKVAPTIRSSRSGLKVAIRTANKQGYDMAANGDGIDLAYPQSQTRRGRVGHGVSKTIMGIDTMGTLGNYRIRKLTPKECWRLMGFADEDFEKAKNAGVSNSQLYKQAGNSIVVDCIQAIMHNVIGAMYGK